MHMYGVSIFESRTENPCVGGSIPPLGTILNQEEKIIGILKG